MTQADYISSYSDQAVLACMFSGYSPAAVLAQAAEESGNGNSTLASQYNNHFGIKATADWTGDTIDLPTPNDSTPVSTFRVYPSATASFSDRNKFLSAQPRYAAVTAAPDASSQVQAIAAAGYAEDPNYASKINSIISANGLDSLDVKKKSSKSLSASSRPFYCSTSSCQLRIRNYELRMKTI